MRFVADVTTTAYLLKEVVVEAETAALACVAAELAVGRALGRQVYLDRANWDTIELDGELSTDRGAEPLLDRRTRERRELGSRSDLQCDACDAEPVSTARYAEARVCSKCLASLPPLSG